MIELVQLRSPRTMAVSIPSDLIVDVMRNADPARAEATARRLEQATSNQSPALEFSQMVNALLSRERESEDNITGAITSEGAELPNIHGGTPVTALRKLSQTEAGGRTGAATYVEFERMVLRNLMEAMMPSAESGIYGGGASSGIWRSMAADQLAGVYAKAGGIGIAEHLHAQEGGGNLTADRQWPYFEANPIQAFTGADMDA
jgi:flagellar protein FlgJ